MEYVFEIFAVKIPEKVYIPQKQILEFIGKNKWTNNRKNLL
jgi:hypothetical protein